MSRISHLRPAPCHPERSEGSATPWYAAEEDGSFGRSSLRMTMPPTVRTPAAACLRWSARPPRGPREWPPATATSAKRTPLPTRPATNARVAHLDSSGPTGCPRRHIRDKLLPCREPHQFRDSQGKDPRHSDRNRSQKVPTQRTPPRSRVDTTADSSQYHTPTGEY
jgi:hypothetical protein